MWHSFPALTLLVLLSLYDAGAQPPTNSATRQTFSNVDIAAANLTNCGPSGSDLEKECVICTGGIEVVTLRCTNNPKCKAFTWDGTCGYLKAAGAPRRPQQGITSVVFTPAGSADAIVAAQRNDTDSEAGSGDTRPDNVNISLPGV